MQKSNIFTKKLSKQYLSINSSIESYFNKLKTFKTKLSKTKLSEDYRVFYILGPLTILTLTYFVMPASYDKNLIKSGIKNQIQERYNIDVKFNENLKYSLFPKPHFYSKNLTILNSENDIGNIGSLKLYISLDRLFAKNYLSIKDIVLKNTDFNLDKDDLDFFKKLLFVEPNEHNLFIKKSNIFFKDKNEEVLFLGKINDSKFFYDFTNFENILVTKNELFNIPFKIIIKNNKSKKKLDVKFNSKKIRLTVNNQTDYKEDLQKGLLDILLINKNTKLDYQIKKNSLNFNSRDKINNYDGFIDFKPFYLSANFNYESLNSRNLLKDDSIIVDIIKSEILNNKNLNINTKFKIKKISDIKELNKLILEISLSNGNIDLSNSKFMWRDDLEFKLKESLIVYDKNEINLITKVSIDVKDLNDFYSSFQISKKNRKKIRNMEFDFNYNLNQKQINFNNVKIDGKTDLKLEKFINNFNSKENRVLNKITFKNFVNNFFRSYAG